MTGYSQFIPEIGKYIDLILLSQLARFKINLFRTTSTELLGSCDGVVEIAIKSLASQVAAIDGEAEALRLSSWNKGHDTQTLDHQLAQCRKMRPGIELASLAAKRICKNTARKRSLQVVAFAQAQELMPTSKIASTCGCSRTLKNRARKKPAVARSSLPVRTWVRSSGRGWC
jgi:hypothetical protein